MAIRHRRFWTEETVAHLIENLYARVRQDPVLAEVFQSAIAPGDWPEHLATMRRFWSSVMRASGRYSGNPVAVHQAVIGLKQPMFARWLALFDRTAEDLLSPETAALFVAKAHRIAASLELALFYRPGNLAKNTRLPFHPALTSSRGGTCG
jgi:hemoglobin